LNDALTNSEAPHVKMGSARIAFARHAGAAIADIGAPTTAAVRGLIRMVLAHPAGVVANWARHEL